MGEVAPSVVASTSASALSFAGRMVAPVLLIFTFWCRSSFTTTLHSRPRHSRADLCDVGWGLNVVVGLAGLLDLGYVAFYAVGAIPTRCWRPIWTVVLGLPAAGRLLARSGHDARFPVLRLRATISRS